MPWLLFKIAALLSGPPRPLFPQAPNTEESAEAPTGAMSGPGRFTREEALLEVGKQVYVRGDALAQEGFARGTLGRVVNAHPQSQSGWVVAVQFDYAPGHSLHVHFPKEAYARSLAEEQDPA
jgi:hypothetical protein